MVNSISFFLFPELDDLTLRTLSQKFRLPCVTIGTGWVDKQKIRWPIAHLKMVEVDDRSTDP